MELAQSIFGEGVEINGAWLQRQSRIRAAGSYTMGPLGIANGGIITSGLAKNAPKGQSPYSDNPYEWNNYVGSKWCGSIEYSIDRFVLFVNMTMSPGYDGLEIQFIIATQEWE